MRIVRNVDPSGPGLVNHYPASAKTSPFQTRIRCAYMGSHFVMPEVAPWGIFLPYFTGLEESANYFFEVETLFMPKDTVLGIRWTPRSGNNVHTLSHTLPGDGEINTGLLIPHAWLNEAQGEDIRIEFEVAYPDGSTETGSGLQAYVSRNLEFGEVAIADLNNGDPFNPENYPDGVQVRIDPIGNVQEYSAIRFYWEVKAYQGDHWFVFLDWFTTQPCAPGKVYEFVIPPEAYNGLDIPAFDRFVINAVPIISLAPEPVPEFRYSLGGWTFAVDYDAK